jgi:hypothetical protein
MTHATPKTLRSTLALVAAAALLSACASMVGTSQAKVALSGSNEVPPVSTSASGQAQFSVDRDWAIQGQVLTTGITGTAAHIHEAAPGSNGPVIIPLTRSGDGQWSVPAGARLTDSQFKSYRAGHLYVNVHSAANPGGEIRGQLTP